MSTPKLRVRDVLDRIHHFPEDHLYAWDGYRYGYGEDAPSPVGGDRVALDDFRRGVHWKSRDERLAEATHVEVLGTVWGDYVGSEYNRSNHRSLLRDYPETFVDVYGGYGSSVLYLPLDAEVDEEVVEVLEGLLDYPIYDESDHSDLVMELEQEAWDLYGRENWVTEVVNHADRTFADTDEVDRFREWLGDLSVTDLNALASDAAYSLDNGHPYFVCEDATGSGYWEGFADEWARAGFLLVIERIDAELLDPEWQPRPVIEGQGLLDVG